MKGGFVTFQDYYNRSSVGSSRIRAKSLYKYWPGVEDYQTGADYDFIIFQKACWIDLADRFSGVKILDLCDPQWQESGRWVEMANKCDAITLSSEALKYDFQRMLPSKRMEVVFDTIDPMACQPQKQKYAEKLQNVIWFGWHTAHFLLDSFIPTLKDLGIELHVVSNKPYSKATTNIRYNEGTINYLLSEADACLLPDYNDFDHNNVDFKHLKYKTDNKDILCHALGVPVLKNIDDLFLYDICVGHDEAANFKANAVFEERCSARAVAKFEALIETIY